MKAIILNGAPLTGDQSFTDYLSSLSKTMEQNSWRVERFDLAAMNIHFCTGCWSCWWKTPGSCVFKDDMEQIVPKLLGADLMIHAAPLSMGFVHSNLKKAMDRIIPLLHPYITLYRGECHHFLRYERTPALGVLVDKEPDTDQEDLEIVSTFFQRQTLNFHNRLLFMKTTEASYAEVLHEINGL